MADAAILAVGFYTKSLALVADAFHYVCPLLSLEKALANEEPSS
jgi:Co/Zn/Cd efflux system component